MTWHKDGQPLVLTQRTQALLGGQRLEIRDAQVSSPWHGQLWVAVGPGPGERGGGTGEPCGPAWGLLPPRPAGSHPESSGLQGRNHEKRAGLPSGSELTLSRSIPDHLPLLAWDLEAFSRPPSLVWMRLTIGCSSGKRCWPPLSWPSAIPTVRDFPPGSAGVQAQGRVGVWNLCPHLPVALLLLEVLGGRPGGPISYGFPGRTSLSGKSLVQKVLWPGCFGGALGTPIPVLGTPSPRALLVLGAG